MINDRIQAPREFNPLRDTLQDNERLRLKDGKLYVENSHIRLNAGCFTRLFTRGQYSQTKILNKIRTLAQEALRKNDEPKKLSKLVKTYSKLIHRAEGQNFRHARTASCVRWILGKSHIDVGGHKLIKDQINAHVIAPKLNKIREEIKEIKEKAGPGQADLVPKRDQLIQELKEIQKKMPEDHIVRAYLFDLEHFDPLKKVEPPIQDPVRDPLNRFLGRVQRGPDLSKFQLFGNRAFNNIEEAVRELGKALPKPLDLQNISDHVLDQMVQHFEQYEAFQKEWERVQDKFRQDARIVELKGRFDKESKEVALAYFNNYEKRLNEAGGSRDECLFILEKNEDPALIQEVAQHLEVAVQEVKLYLDQLQNEPIVSFINQLEGAKVKIEYEVNQNAKAQEKIDLIANKRKLEIFNDELLKEVQEFKQNEGNPKEAKELAETQLFYKKLLNRIRSIEPKYGEELFNNIAGARKEEIKKAYKVAKGEVQELLKKQPELEKEIKAILHPQDEMKVEEALHIMEEACKAIKDSNKVHYRILRVFMNVGKYQKELLDYVANTPKVIRLDGHVAHEKPNAVGDYLRVKTQDTETEKKLIFHAELQNQEHHIRQAAAIYAKAYNYAVKNNLTDDFFRSVFDGSNACIEGNIGQITEWLEDVDPTMDKDLFLDLKARDNLHYNLGRYNDVFQEVQFRAYHLEKYKMAFNKRDKEHLQRRKNFKNGPAAEHETARQKWLTQAQFVQFMKQDDKHYPIKCKDGEITKDNLEAKVQEYQDVCDVLY